MDLNSVPPNVMSGLYDAAGNRKLSGNYSNAIPIVLMSRGRSRVSILSANGVPYRAVRHIRSYSTDSIYSTNDNRNADSR